LKGILSSAQTDELVQLVKLIEYRLGVLSEALRQCDTLVDYFSGVFGFTAAAYPKTYGLAIIAQRVGEFVAMHWKAVFDRPRPSRLSPALMPPVAVPGHASFPSGHATQSQLMALALAEVMPEAASLAEYPPRSGKKVAQGPLYRVAERIARNREVMGLHYPSDSDAGKKLAELTWDILKQCLSVAQMITDAQKEWSPRS
jgi:membrane-associated phospholipid phosphatase